MSYICMSYGSLCILVGHTHTEGENRHVCYPDILCIISCGCPISKEDGWIKLCKK